MSDFPVCLIGACAKQIDSFEIYIRIDRILVFPHVGQVKALIVAMLEYNVIMGVRLSVKDWCLASKSYRIV